MKTTIENNLLNITDILRRDVGINGAMQSLEQMSWLLLLKYIDELYSINFTGENVSIDEGMRWSCWSDYENNGHLPPKELIHFVKHDLFPYFASRERFERAVNLPHSMSGIVNSVFSNITNRIISGVTLERVIHQLNQINLFDIESVGPAYERLIRNMSSNAGQSGEFYSPRSTISAIVEVLHPCSNEKIYDPTLGSCGFLVEAFKRMRIANTHQDKTSGDIFYGCELSPSAYLIGLTNMLLHGIVKPNICLGNALTKEIITEEGSGYDLIFSNPPFGKLDKQFLYEINEHELVFADSIFVKHIFEKLNHGGRAAVIVPERFLFDKNKNSVKLRRKLLDEFNLHTILSLPSGIMLPYTAVKVSVLFIERTHRTEDIWYYDLQSSKKLSKNNQLLESDFKDFTVKYDSRTASDNSWLVSRGELDEYDDFSAKSPNQANRVAPKSPLEILSSLRTKEHNIRKLYGKLEQIVDNSNIKNNCNQRIQVKIEDVFSTTSGKLLSKKVIKETGKYPVYGGNGIMGYHDEFNLKGENILIGRVGSLSGNIHYTTDKIWLTNNSFSIEVKNNHKVYLPYLAKVLKSIDLNKAAAGTAQASISYSKIKNICFSLPDYDAQVRLSDWMDDLIGVTEETNQILASQAEDLNILQDNLVAFTCKTFEA